MLYNQKLLLSDELRDVFLTLDPGLLLLKNKPLTKDTVNISGYISIVRYLQLTVRYFVLLACEYLKTISA